MKFSIQRSVEVVFDITVYITSKLKAGQIVLWLTSGGSATTVQVEIMKHLREDASDWLGNLTILPVDERYGEYGHENSNSTQIREAGFEPGDATWYDVLKNNLPMPETVSYYAELAENAFATATVVVATLGMGPDAHTAGILPGSPAVTDTTSTVVGYSWSDYERMTLGIPTLLKINSAFLLAYGEAKKEALERLRKNEEPVEELPAKILYDISDVTVYNDFIQT
ncbi:MAG: 6-phosphogluconolactonase [Candidatus Saccharimonadales bacterium]|nr:6-phosphogluconolactonase [Candidatus Saccharibacteria bacterium]